MQKRSIMQRASAVALAAAMAITLSVAPTTQANAASKQSVNVITTAKTSDGATIKYTYNKKGLVKKSVSKSSYKTNGYSDQYSDQNDSIYDDDYSNTINNLKNKVSSNNVAQDVSKTITTTYKYNKKNKISSETQKSVTKTTYTQMDKTTGLKEVAKLGTITTTQTDVTKYTYNKKGRATKSVTTSTTTKSGTKTATYKTLLVGGTELSDGRRIAGYNVYAADGSKYADNSSANAYYYTNPAASEGTVTVTTSYTPNADGTYTENVTSTSTGGYTTEAVKSYYATVWANDTKTVVPVTETKNEYGRTVYVDAAGNYYNEDDTFFVINSVNVVPSTVADTQTKTTTTIITDKSVDTVKYTYDKKKRLKKAASTYVVSTGSVVNGNDSTTSATSKKEESYKSEQTSEKTIANTTTFTYDKKGRAKKVVYSEPGKNESKTTSTGKITLTSSSSSTSTDTYSSGSSTYTNSNTHTYTYPNGSAELTTIVTSNGTETKTVTKYPYTDNYEEASSRTYTSPVGSSTYGSSVKGTTEFTYYGNGGSKIVDNYAETSVDDGVTSSRTVSKTEYDFDKAGNSYGTVSVYNGTYSDGTPYTNSYASYYNGVQYIDDVAATVAMAPAIAANEASGAVYNEVTTAAALAAPYKATTKYTYDKNGNVKTTKTSGTDTEVTNVLNETYGNVICTFDANGKAQPVKTSYTHKFAYNYSKENTVKTGTKNLTRVLTKTTKNKNDRAEGTSYGIGERKMTLKAKKYTSKNASLVKKQQWMIQNGNLNGVVGL